LRDPRRAVAAASKAVELAPQDALGWQVLGMARYRAGEWKASSAALNKSIALQHNPKGSNPTLWLFLAMAHGQLGEKDEARRWYDRAVRFLEQRAPRNEEWRRLQSEAATLLKVNDRPKSEPER
jgi:tetratricopeptide (TPR) repeat protein